MSQKQIEGTNRKFTELEDRADIGPLDDTNLVCFKLDRRRGFQVARVDIEICKRSAAVPAAVRRASSPAVWQFPTLRAGRPQDSRQDAGATQNQCFTASYVS